MNTNTQNTLATIVKAYRDGYRFVAKQGDNHAFEPFRSRREAVEWALNGRTEFRAVRDGAAVERIDELVRILLGDDTDKVDPYVLDGLTVADLKTIGKILTRSTATAKTK